MTWLSPLPGTALATPTCGTSFFSFLALFRKTRKRYFNDKKTRSVSAMCATWLYSGGCLHPTFGGWVSKDNGKEESHFEKGWNPKKRGPTFVFWKGKCLQHGKCKAIVYMQAVWEGCAVVPMILFCNWSYSNWEVRSEEVSRVQPMSCAFLEIFSSNLSQENSPSILSLLFRWNGNARYRGHERQGRSLEKHLAQLAVKLNVL